MTTIPCPTPHIRAAPRSENGCASGRGRGSEIGGRHKTRKGRTRPDGGTLTPRRVLPRSTYCFFLVRDLRFNLPFPHLRQQQVGLTRPLPHLLSSQRWTRPLAPKKTFDQKKSCRDLKEKKIFESWNSASSRKKRFCGRCKK